MGGEWEIGEWEMGKGGMEVVMGPSANHEVPGVHCGRWRGAQR
jgi:hypothetical protein